MKRDRSWATHVRWDSKSPHCDTSETSCDHHGAQTECTRVGALGSELLLDGFVRQEVGGTARSVTRQCGTCATVDRSQTSFAVEFAYGVERARVELLTTLTLHLEGEVDDVSAERLLRIRHRNLECVRT